MLKTDLLEQIAKDLKSLASSIDKLILIELDENKNEKSSNSKAKKSESVKKEATEKEISLEDVRAVLADKSRLGFTSKIKEILKGFGANKLSDVSTSDYPELLKLARELKDE